MIKEATGKKKYMLQLPQELYDELDDLSSEWGTSVAEVMKRFFRLGLTAVNLQKSENGALILREDGIDREIIMF